MKCPRCQYENRPQAKFCEECATPLSRVCSNCSALLSPTAKFCPECAHPVTTGAQPRFASPDSYTPKHLAAWKRNPGQYDGLDHRCLTCRQDDAAHATAHTKAIAASLVALFGLLPNDGWRQQLAQEIRESNSCQTLTWASGDLESFVVEYSVEDSTG